MPDDSERKEGQGSGGQNPPRPQQGPPRGKQKKSLFDITNVVGVVFWLVTAIMGCAVAVNILVPVPSVCRAADLMIEPVCFRSQVLISTYFVPVFVFALVVQILITIMSRRVHDKQFQKGVLAVELFINFVGYYWLICVQLGYVESLRTAGKTLVPIFTNMGTFVAIAFMIGGAYLAYWLPNVCWDAQPAAGTQAPPQQGQRR